MDSVVILNEVIEDAKRVKKEAMFFKINFIKTYNSVEWSFLRAVMEILNFHYKWIEWVI